MAYRIWLWGLLTCVGPLPAGAQDVTAAAQQAAPEVVDPAMVAALYMESEPRALRDSEPRHATTPAQAVPSAERSRLRRGRWLTVLGSGFALGAAVGLAAMGRSQYCTQNEFSYDKTAPRVTGAAFGGLGLSLAIPGLLLIRSVPGETRSVLSTSRGKRIGMAFTGFGAAALTVAGIGMASLPDWVRCGTS